MKRASLSLGVVLVLAISSPHSGQAAVFQLDTEFSGATEPAGTPPWLTATFKDIGVDLVELTMSASGLVSDEFVSEWYFNFDPNLDVSLLSFAYQSSESDVEAAGYSTGVNAFKADGDGFFDIKFEFPQAKNDRFGADLTSVYNISSTQTITAASFDFASVDSNKGAFESAAHVQGIGDDAEGSGWIGPGGPQPTGSVPEPGALAIWGAGLALSLLWGLRHRRRAP